MPEEWRTAQYFKNKDNVKSCINYRRIMVKSHSMKPECFMCYVCLKSVDGDV